MIFGKGRLVIDGVDTEKIEYNLEVSRGLRVKASGYIYGDTDLLIKAFKAKSLQIQRADLNHLITIVITNVGIEGRAEVFVSGDPGPDNDFHNHP